MKNGDKEMKIWGLIVILMLVVSLFSGVVSAEDVSGDLTKSVADTEIQATVDNASSDELAKYNIVLDEDPLRYGLYSYQSCTLYAVADGYAWSGGTVNPSGASSTSEKLRVGFKMASGNYRTLIKFDLSSIPAGATITSADLKLYYHLYGGTAGDPLGISVYRTTVDWNEGYLSWSKAENYNLFSYDTVTIIAGSGAGYKAWDITSLVQSWVDGTYNNYGVLLRAPTQSGSSIYRSFRSKEYGSNVPKLEVAYTQIPTPVITGINPPEPVASPTRQWISILGTGFVSDSTVTLRIGSSEYPIPSDRTDFRSSTEIRVYVGLTDTGTWTVQVTNPGNKQSNIFSFTVVPPTPVNVPPELSNGYVTPTSGDTSTPFDYYVTYKDQDGDAPTTKYVYINGLPHEMLICEASSPSYPEKIRVLRYETGQIDEVDFDYYVKNVLPNEWAACWDWDIRALKAGAMAVKTYAWYWTIHQKYPGQGYDVRDDTWDQVYDPDWRTKFILATPEERYNEAVEETWNWVMMKNDEVFQSQYDSGTPGLPDPLYSGRMSQWGTQYWAEGGKDWQWICHYYYDPITLVSGSYVSGATFKYSTTLPAGNHNYYFYFDDGHGHTKRLPPSGTYPGPSVSQPIQLPQVSTNSASNIGTSSTTLNGNLDNTGGETCQVWFEWGLTTSYGHSTTKQSKSTTGSFSSQISGLQSGKTYHFKACASNSKGTVCGSDRIFATTTSFTDQQKQQEILNMVNSHRGSLPAELVLAIIRQEGGEGAFHVDGWNYNSFYKESDGPWAQPTNGDGIMQVTLASGYHEKSGPYTHDRNGYDHAINDGCDYLLELYNSYGSRVQITLHYNTGPNSLYIYLGKNQGDRNYLSHVAEHLSNFVPNTYGLQDPNLVSALNQGQNILNDYLYNKGLTTGQSVDYYRPYQEQLDKELHNIGHPPVKDLQVPYIHQCWDTPNDFDGRWACGATSAVMVLAYYGKIDPWPCECSLPYSHTSDFGNYICRSYTYNSYTFDTMTPDASGNSAYGAYGYIHYSDGLAKLGRMVDYFQKHELDSWEKYNPSESQVKAELDAGYPVPASTKLTLAGHWIVIKGYTNDGYYIVNDPYGSKPYGSGICGNYNGADVLYTWDEMKVNEKWVAIVHPITDTVSPTVDAFDVTPRSLILGNAFTISYTVSDTGGSGLSRGELWRKYETGNWEEIDATSLSGVGNGPYSDSFSDAPPSVGTYWYGMHVVDNEGNWAPEDSPIKVEVKLPTYPPQVTTNAASSIGTTSATLNGNLDDTGGETCQVWFQYGKTTSYSDFLPSKSKSSTGSFSDVVSCLDDDTIYHFRAVASNSEGTVFGSDMTFKTDKEIDPPQVTTNAATNVEETTATLNGVINNDGGEACQYRFEYDTNSGEPYAYNTGWTGSKTTGQSLNAPIPCLGKGTKYYFRAQAKNSAGTASGSELTFLTKPDVPTSFSATTAGTTQIDLSWTKGAGAQKTRMQRKQGSYPANKDDGTQVYFGTGTSKADTGLTEGTTYYYRAWSYVQGSEQWSDNHAQDWATTTSIGAPTVTTNAATNVEETTATFNGVISSDGGEASQYRFEYDTNSGEPYAYNTGWTGSKTTGQSFSEAISSLAKGTKYYFRAQAKNSAGTASGFELTFLTKPDSPTSFSATTASTTQIDLSWTKGAGAQKTKIQRKQGSYPSNKDDGTQVYFGTGTSTSDTGLTECTTYYYRAWSYVQGSEQWSDNYAQDWATTTSIGAPTVTTNAATSIGTTSATLNGNLDDTGGESCQVWFEYGKTMSYGYSTPKQSKSSTGSFSKGISGLDDDTTYHVRAVASNSKGTVYGLDKTFKTEKEIKPPEVTTKSASSIGTSSATLNGNLDSTGGETCQVWFEYGKTTSYGYSTPKQSKSSTGSFSKGISGLDDDTTYHFRAVASNSKGTDYGDDMTFTTSEEADTPSVSISTDKTAYGPGDTMNITIGFKNPTPDSIDTYFIWYFGLPDYGYWTPVMTTPLTLPAGFDQLHYFSLAIGDWGDYSFNASWYVALYNTTTLEVLSEDTADWRYVPAKERARDGNELMPEVEEIAGEISKTVEKIKFPT